MKKIKAAVVGYGVIGQRLADGVAAQGDMELTGIVDVAPTLSIRAMLESKDIYPIYVFEKSQADAFKSEGISVEGDLGDILKKVDIVLDATPAGIGLKNKEIYKSYGKKAIFQGGENNDVADVFFHGYANYDKGIGKDYLKLTSCNTTGFIRVVDCIDKAVGVERVVAYHHKKSS